MRSIGTLVWLAVALACGAPAKTETAPANRASAPASSEGVQYVGDPSAKVALTYYFDYECPHCYTFKPRIEELERKYGNRIVVYYKNFQLRKHQTARFAAIAAEAARRQGRFVDMHRLLMDYGKAEQQSDAPTGFTPDVVRGFAAKLGLDLARFDRDVKDTSAGTRVDGEYAEGERHGVEFVPVVYFGADRYIGDMEVGALSATIDARLGH